MQARFESGLLLTASQMMRTGSVRLRVYMLQFDDRRAGRRTSAQPFACWAVCAAILLFASSGAAQTKPTAPPADLHGAITTQNGAVFLPGAIVTVSDKSGEKVAEATSDDSGKYEVPNLPPGTYTVRAFLDGFTEAL